MKKMIIFLILLFTGFALFSQDLAPIAGGGYEFQQESKCLTDVQRTAIQSLIATNRADLIKKGVLKEPNLNTPETGTFAWPLRKSPELPFFNYYGVSGFVDQDPTSGLSDFSCGKRTYDGHRGTDFFTWPFPWYIYDHNYVEVITGEAGTIIAKQDGYDDNHCSWFGDWNAVYVQHADGSIAWYGHMKRNSLTSKNVGDQVAQGEYLGVVASSGWSTGPHLHLEIYDKDNNLNDPYSGNCNDFNDNSWWNVQPTYRESRVNALLTHRTKPVFGCPGEKEASHLLNNFSIGDTVFTGVYYQDQLVGQITNLKIKAPNSAVWQTWTTSSNTDYSGSWWIWKWLLPANGPFGTWTLEATYEGQTYVHEFQYTSSPVGLVEANDVLNVQIFPNPTNGEILLSGNTVDAVTVRDALGRRMEGVGFHHQVIDISNLQAGLYFLLLETSEGVVARRVVKN